MENYFIANSILEDEQKQSILLTSVSPATYKLLWNLVSPQKPSENSFNELVAAMKSQCCLVPSVIIQRFPFHRQQEKLISTFMAELGALLEHYDFRNALEDML